MDTMRLSDNTPPAAISSIGEQPRGEPDAQDVFDPFENMTDPLPPDILEMLGDDMMDIGHNRDFHSEWNQLTSPIAEATQDESTKFIDADETLTPQVIGASGDLDPCLLDNYRFDDSQKFCFKKLTIQSTHQGADPIHFLLSDPALYDSSRGETGLLDINIQELQPRLESIVSVSQGVMLVRLFERYVSPSYPIFSAEHPPHPSSSPPYLLAAIYSCVQHFIKFDGDLAVELAYKGVSSAELVQIAWTALNSQLHTPTIQVLQTLMVLLIRPSIMSSVSEAPYLWTLLGKMVTCGQTLGLQYDAARWSGTQPQRAQRQRLSFLIWAMDKWMACSLGRPPLIYQDNWLICSVGEEHFHDSGLNTSQQQCLRDFSDLTNTLTQVLGSL